MPLVLANFILFQLGWFACVLGAANDLPWLGVVVVGAIVAFHLAMADSPYREIQLIILTVFVGGLWDSLMVVTGQLVYTNGMLISSMAPYWILSMWLLFATTFNISLRWMKNRLLLAAALGASFGPIAYYAGSMLGAVTMPDTLTSSLVIGLGWLFIMPMLMQLSNFFDGFLETAKAGN